MAAGLVIHRDFILRLIEQLGAIARALISGERGDNSRGNAEAALADAAQQGLGLSLQALHGIEPAALAQLFRSGGAIGNSRIALAAAIFSCEAKIRATKGEISAAVPLAEKALYLLEQIGGEAVAREEYSVEQHRDEMVAFLRTNRSA